VLQQADVIFGAEHQFDKLDSTSSELINIAAERIFYPSPWSDLGEKLFAQQSKKVVMLASGDALFFGLGSWLIEQIGEQNCRFFSNVSSVQAAFALLNKPWEEAQIISLHGRPLQKLRSCLRRNTLYGILTDSKNTPTVVANEILALGYDQAKIWVVEAINNPAHKISLFTPKELVDHSQPFHALNLLVVESGTGKTIIPEFPGFPDAFFSQESLEPESENFNESGMFTKREVRLTILSLLQPVAGQVGWDVGAGFGSVSIEWARWQSSATIHAVENNLQRMDILKKNIYKFGVSDQVLLYKGQAPIILQKLPTPDAVYIGGSQGGIVQLLDYCWRRLSDHGRLVISAVTELTKANLITHVETKYAKHIQSIEWTEVAVSKGRSLGGQLVLQPKLPVLILSIQKQSRSYGE